MQRSGWSDEGQGSGKEVRFTVSTNKLSSKCVVVIIKKPQEKREAKEHILCMKLFPLFASKLQTVDAFGMKINKTLM